MITATLGENPLLLMASHSPFRPCLPERHRIYEEGAIKRCSCKVAACSWLLSRKARFALSGDAALGYGYSGTSASSKCESELEHVRMDRRGHMASPLVRPFLICGQLGMPCIKTEEDRRRAASTQPFFFNSGRRVSQRAYSEV